MRNNGLSNDCLTYGDLVLEKAEQKSDLKAFCVNKDCQASPRAEFFRVRKIGVAAAVPQVMQDGASCKSCGHALYFSRSYIGCPKTDEHCAPDGAEVKPKKKRKKRIRNRTKHAKKPD